MKLKSLLVLLSFCLLPVAAVQAQMKTSFFQDIEVFGGIGTTHYFGDIGGKETSWHEQHKFLAVFDNLDIDPEMTRVMFTGGARFTRWKSFAITAQLSPVFISGSDYNSDYAKMGIPGRPYEFNTTIIELSAIGEYYFAQRMTGFAPYGFAGLSGMLFRYTNSRNDKPKWDNGNTFIVGLGVRLPSVKQLTHSFDLSYHFATTDYLDGYHTDRNSKDLFVSFSYKVNIESFSLWTYDHKGLVK